MDLPDPHVGKVVADYRELGLLLLDDVQSLTAVVDSRRLEVRPPKFQGEDHLLDRVRILAEE